MRSHANDADDCTSTHVAGSLDDLVQECATVPANPFPEPTNGKAIAMWKEVKALAVPEGTHGSGDHTSGSGENGGNSGRGSPELAEVVQSAMLQALGDTRKAKQVRADGCLSHQATTEGTRFACGGTDSSSGSSNSRCGGSSREQGREMAMGMVEVERGLSLGMESSTPVMLGDTQRGNGGGGGSGGSCSGSKGMRQESYYLRGPVEPERDEKLLATIAACIPGNET